MISAASADAPQTPAVCDYCGLPVRGSTNPTTEPQFCCLGCQLASAIITDASDSDFGMSRTALQLGLAVFFSMNVMVFTMALWSWDTYAIPASPSAAILKELLRFACLLFATPVVLILGKPLAMNVATQLKHRILTADFLLLMGVTAAFVYSVISVLTGQPHIYFEVACMILVAVTLGRWLEAEGKHRAMKSLQSLQNLLPETARVVAEDGQLSSQSLNDVTKGQVIRVLPGERVPLDGTILRGQSFIDQQLVTGESRAECRSIGDRVFGGTANLDGRLDVRVDADAACGLIQRLVASVREAASQTSRPQRLADRLAAIFVPLVFVIVLGVFIFHWRTAGAHQALMSSMAVALIACPCALAIATPLAVWAALGNAARRGIVFRTSDDLTALAEIDHVCIDKTGTVTTDQPRLAGSWYLDGSHEAAVTVTKQLASQTLHPLAAALDEQLEQYDGNTSSIGPARTAPGKGVSAELTLAAPNQAAFSTVAVLGSPEYCHDRGLHFSARLQRVKDQALDRGQPLVCVGWESQVQGVFAFEESLRPEAAAAIGALKALALSATLLTGDRVERANQIATALGVDAAAQLLPEDKQQVVARLQSQGHRVAMLGDGLNDAPALSAADLGVALGCGAEVTRDAADICLMSSDLNLLPWAIELSRATRRTIHRNLVWAVGYNAVGIALAATGKLNPIFAALAMVFSSAFVIAESLRLSARPGPPTATESRQRQVAASAPSQDERFTVETSGS